jgi:5-methylthioribose kinase
VRDGLLSAGTVGEYLVHRGLVPEGTPVAARELGGGVSNVVLAVEAAGRRLVVKQSLARLRVADEWLAKRERVLTEGAALRLVGKLVPGAVPEVFDVDSDRCAITIACAPGGWRSWKELLLAGEADADVSRRLGAILAAWQRLTAGDAEVERRFGDYEAFDQLRVDPYHRAVMRRHPELAAPVAAHVERMLATRLCLVDGDFSPKNVLTGDGGLWIVDFEVAHVGDPAFDLAFMLNHLMLKAIHRPVVLDGYERCAAAFWDAYRAGAGDGLAPEPAYVLGHLGCVMVARVDGKSPAEYLDPAGGNVARELGSSFVLDAPASLQAAWERLREAVAP